MKWIKWTLLLLTSLFLMACAEEPGPYSDSTPNGIQSDPAHSTTPAPRSTLGPGLPGRGY